MSEATVKKEVRILVTGCCGFIGSHLTEALLLLPGVEVVGVDNMNEYYDPQIKEAHLCRLQACANFTFLQEDMVHSQCVTLWKPDIVYHIASLAGVRNSLRNPTDYVTHNIEAFVNLLQQAVQAKVRSVFYASSSSVYGTSTLLPYSEQDTSLTCKSPYACSKLAMEMFAKTYNQLYGVHCVGFRFFTVYGPRGRPDMAPFKFLKAIHEGRPLDKFGDGSTSRDYTYIDDIVNGLVQAMKLPPEGCDIFNLGNSNPVSLNTFIATCEQVVGKDAHICHKGMQMGDVDHTHADVSKAQAQLEFTPKISLKEGLSRMYHSYKSLWDA